MPMHPSGRHPDIILIVVDTQRRDRLGCYGYGRNTTPNIDTFAAGSTLYERAISPGQWTIPVHASWFSGEPVSTHGVTQSGDVLDPAYPTLAQRLCAAGYHTVGFCNNPLVGVVQNGFRRGFERFYSYCGAVRTVPRPARWLPGPMRAAWERYRAALRRVTDPIQNAFATSNRVFQGALNPLWVPLWTRFARFKGDTARSIRDCTAYVRERMADGDRAPVFLFLNVMEPHLPYTPDRRFADAFVPYLRTDRRARDFVHRFNAEARRWLVPLSAPFTSDEARTLHDMYDAEVAYQDALLAELLEVLDQEQHREGAIVIVVSDHGEMLGEHGLMGHGFGVYGELVHVPMIVRYPGQTRANCVRDVVSTTRLFHTALHLAGEEVCTTADGRRVLLEPVTLARDTWRVSSPIAFSEAYAPEFALRIMDRHYPWLVGAMDCEATNWAVVSQEHKLIRTEQVSDRLYALAQDPGELNPLSGNGYGALSESLAARLDAFVERAQSHRLENRSRGKADLDDDAVRQRLRGLGYVD